MSRQLRHDVNAQRCQVIDRSCSFILTLAWCLPLLQINSRYDARHGSARLSEMTQYAGVAREQCPDHWGWHAGQR